MNLIVRAQQRLVANIDVEPGRPLTVVVHDQTFEPWVKRLQVEKLTVMRDEETDHGHRMYRVDADPADENYGLIVKQYLERHDFDVTIDDPELDQAVLLAVQSLPNDYPGKEEIVHEVPMLTTLEKTTLLERLQRKA